MTRLEAFADRVTREMLYLWRVEDTKGYPGCDGVGTASARAVLEREVRSFVTNAIGHVNVADEWCDKVTP